jgi:uncharacterized repeat protein (TIGR01451 family)
MRMRVLFVGVFVLIFTRSTAVLTSASTVKTENAYGMLPLRFEANMGQTDSQVKFLSRGKGYTLFLSATESILTLKKPVAAEKEPNGADKLNAFIRKPVAVEQAVLRMKIQGSNRGARVIGMDELAGKSNYFIGNDAAKWRTDVPNFAKVRYEGIYPGIDLVYYGNQTRLEYDFIVAPHADPRIITLEFEGADDVAIDQAGDLVLRAGSGEIRQHKPVVYQEINDVKRAVASEYRMKGEREVGFQIAAYDPTRPLIIDPILSYSTYLGGSSDDAGVGVAVDINGNAYVTGYTSSTNFPTTAAYDPGCGTDNSCNLDRTWNATFEDVFITKLNPSGTAAIYSTYIGGSNMETGTAIAADGSGAAYVTGYTRSTSDFPRVNQISGGLYQGGGSEEVFVLKLNATGSTLVYSSLLGSGNSDVGLGIAVDIYGATYLTGATQSEYYPTTAGAFRSTRLGRGYAAFVTKVTPSGTVLYPGAPALAYSTFLGADCSVDTAGLDIAITGGEDPSEVFITGFTGCIETTEYAYQPGPGSGFFRDAFVSHLNSTGSALLYSTYLGGTGNDEGSAITIDETGIYVAGHTGSGNFPGASSSPIQNMLRGGMDAFVTKFDISTGGLIYSTFLGGSAGDAAAGIKVRNRRVYVAGSTSSTDFPGAAASTMWPNLRGARDAFVAELNAQGSAIVHATYLGGTTDEGMGVIFPQTPTVGGVAHSLALDSAGNLYVAGSTNSTDFPMVPMATPYQGTFGGAPEDAFVVKLAPTIDLAVTKTGPPTATVDYTGNYTIVASNVGSFDATNVVVTDHLPSAVKLAGSPHTTAGTCTTSGNTVTCNVGNLASGAQATITVPVKFMVEKTFSNTATIAAAEVDLNTANNSSTFTTTVTKSCAVNVTAQMKVTAGSVSASGSQTVSVRNDGATPVSATVSIVLDNLTGFGWLSNKSGDTVCNAPLGRPYKDINVGSDNVLKPGETAVVTLQFTRIPGGPPISYTPRILAGPGSR